MKKLLSLIAVAVARTACGGGGGGGPDPVVLQPEPPAPVPLVDAFFTRVSAFVAGASETDDPADIAAVVMTAPEDTEPVAL